MRMKLIFMIIVGLVLLSSCASVSPVKSIVLAGDAAVKNYTVIVLFRITNNNETAYDIFNRVQAALVQHHIEAMDWTGFFSTTNEIIIKFRSIPEKTMNTIYLKLCSIPNVTGINIYRN